MPAYIHDGCTVKGYVAESPRLHPEIRFKYRPATVEEASGFLESNAGLRAKEADRNIAEFLRTRIVSWDLKDEKGNILPIRGKSIARLNRIVFLRLYGMILGNEGGDLDPAWTDEETEEHVAIKAGAAAEGTVPGAIREDRDTKN